VEEQEIMTESITQLTQKVDALTELVGTLVDNQRWQKELYEELSPILREVMGVGTSKLGALEQRGYFEFAREAMKVFDTVVTSYSGEDVRQLGNNIVGILDTLRRITQPDVLAVAADATQAIEHAEGTKPKGIFRMLKDSRDDDVRRGMAMLLEVLRYVGRGTKNLHADRPQLPAASEAQPRPPQPTLSKLLAPRRAQPSAAPSAEASSEVAPSSAGGVDGDRCLWVEEGRWDRAWATTVARSIGIEITEAHWALLSAARDDYKESGASPNIRRLTRISKISTREIYTLFPIKPGIAVALCAGIPKPGGCI